MISKIFRRFSSVTKPVSIKYKDLVSEGMNIFPQIEEAYGIDGLGLLVIEDVPGFEEKRNSALKTIHKLAHLPEPTLRKIESPELNYSRGWSRGKEIYENEPDTLKGSFYSALPPHNGRNFKKDQNKWPDDSLPELKPILQETGSEMRKVGLVLLGYIDRYIKSRFPSHNFDTTKNQVAESEMCVSRGLYYYPKNSVPKIDKNYLWSGWHNDHGSLTALCSAMYLDEKGNQGSFKLTETGLFIKNRKGQDLRVTHRPCDIAFQIGETLQVQSGGTLHATPHSVIVGDDIPDNFGRSTYVLFMEPNLDVKIDIPSGANPQNVQTSSIYKVPKIQDRFKQGMTFGEFNDITNEYYASMNKVKV